MSRLLQLLALLLVTGLALPAEDEYAAERESMIRTIEDTVRATSRELGRQNLDARVLEAMRSVPRHALVPAQHRSAAYRNRPVPIGYGQTISQPYIVAIMTDLLNPEPTHNVLEIGTGSGYQAAILSRLVGKVYSIEIVPELADRARLDLADLGYDNIHTRLGDGYFGWPDAAPFDAIVVTAAANHVPPPLIRQLQDGGRMIIPVGSRFLTQQLLLIEKDKEGQLRTRQILPVRFVPLTGKH